MLIRDGIDAIGVDEEASVRLDLDDGAVLLVHVDFVAGDDVLQLVGLQLLLGALGHAYKEGMLHAAVEMAKDVPLGLLGGEAAAAAHEALDDLPHGAFAAALRAHQADDDADLLVGVLHGVREQIE